MFKLESDEAERKTSICEENAIVEDQSKRYSARGWRPWTGRAMINDLPIVSFSLRNDRTLCESLIAFGWAMHCDDVSSPSNHIGAISMRHALVFSLFPHFFRPLHRSSSRYASASLSIYDMAVWTCPSVWWFFLSLSRFVVDVVVVVEILSSACPSVLVCVCVSIDQLLIELRCWKHSSRRGEKLIKHVEISRSFAAENSSHLRWFLSEHFQADQDAFGNDRFDQQQFDIFLSGLTFFPFQPFVYLL